MAKVAGTTVSVEVKGLKKALLKMTSVERQAMDFKKPFVRSKIYMHKSWGDSFRTGKRGKERWDDNSPATVIIKKGSNPLLDRGMLRNSLTGAHTKSHLKYSKRRFEIGTTISYAKLQNEGINIPVTQAMRRYISGKYGIVLGSTVKIPPRPFMFFTEKDISSIKKIFELWLEEVILTA